MTFERIFQNIVLRQKTGKGTERTKYLISDLKTFLKKSSITVIFYVIVARKICLKYILKMFKISIND